MNFLEKWFQKVFGKTQTTTNPTVSTNFPEGYAVIKGDFVENFSQTMQRKLSSKSKHPHFNFNINVGDTPFQINVNVRSRDPQAPDLMVFYTENFNEDIINKAPFLKMYEASPGVYSDVDATTKLDYLRDNLFDLKQLHILRDGVNPNEQVLVDTLNKYLTEAKSAKYHVVVWGFLYDNKMRSGDVYGMHDVHMNQGSVNGSENFVGKDGALMFCNEQGVQFLIFLVFSSQCLKTNDQTGECAK
ncbi:DUF2278 family protein [Candidatus Mycoplasma pogonae]